MSALTCRLSLPDWLKWGMDFTSWLCHSCLSNLESSRGWWTWPTFLSQFPWVATGLFFIFLTAVSSIGQISCVFFLSKPNLQFLEVFKRSKARQWIPWRLTAGSSHNNSNGSSEATRVMAWRKLMGGPHCVLLSVVHRTAGEARKSSIHQIKMSWRGMRGRQKRIWYQAIEGKKHEVLEELLWFNTLGNTGWCQFRQKEEESFLGEGAVHLFTSIENVWTDFTLTCAQKAPSNTPLDTPPVRCLQPGFHIFAYSYVLPILEKLWNARHNQTYNLRKPKTQTPCF